MYQGFREFINRFVEMCAKNEVGEVWREIIHWFVEAAEFVKCEGEERGWQTVDRAVEHKAKGQVGECRRKAVDMLVESAAQDEVSEGRRKVVDRMVEIIRKSKVSNMRG
jgi:methanogenic corrinoid protein MtbC1